MSAAKQAGTLLRVDGLRVHFGKPRQPVRAVDGVDLFVKPGESVGLVGESGCGKTTLGRAIMRLVDVTAGRIEFAGRDIATLRGAELVEYRRQAQMIFQDPYGSLNARMSVGNAIQEVMQVHRLGTRAERRARAAALFDAVGLDPAYLDRYPHEFSGGQRQRIGIARALAVDPQLIIADEPVSALDVSVQVQILNLMKDLQQRMGLAYLFVAHDLAVVRYVCDRIYVMYLGRIVESGTPDTLFSRPAHPYTQALLSAVPDVDKGLRARRGGTDRVVLKGDVPSPVRRIDGCPFHPRCPVAQDRCRTEVPALRALTAEREAACHYAE